ncbi:hypothetical protein OG976_07005 [Mycobacterium sp. NBC_00419]|uniref:hypothetical protein n=1 Tax=Mycobacterium sp. NBC_00419 TaxID=2975989 RepID=UPI002E1AD522
MRKAMGPILTTGVALVAAAVVVANPVVPPIRDMQISTTQLSTSPESLIPFDKSLLNSISQQTAPFGSALAQILGALAAEADRIGSEVNSATYDAAPAPAGALVPPAYNPAAAVPFVETNGAPSAAAAAAALPAASVTADVQQVVTNLVQDTTYLGSKVVEAAYAYVDVLVNTPNLIAKAILALVKGDLVSALTTIVEAIKAFFSPGLILIGGLQDIIDSLTGQSSIPLTPAAATSLTPGTETGNAPAGAGGTGASATDEEPPTTVGQSGRNRTPKAPRISARAAQTDPATDPAKAEDSTDSAPQPGSTPTSTSVADSARGAAGSSARPQPVTQPKPRTTGAPKPSTGTAKDQSAGGQGATAGD